MKTLFCGFALWFFSVSVQAQQPNCQINFGPWTDTAASPAFNNVGAGTNNQCTYWVMNYQVDGFSVISLQFESATGAVSAGAFGAFSGTVLSGVNPSTSVVCSTVTNCTSTFTGAVGWYRVNFSSHTGSGTIRGTVKGYIGGIPLGGALPPSGTACPGTAATPCVVAGSAADGAAVAGNPVLQAGFDGTNTQTILTDTAGRQIEVGAGANAAALVGFPVRIGISDTVNTRDLQSASALGDTGSGFAAAAVANILFNGASFDRQRSGGATGAAAVAGAAPAGAAVAGNPVMPAFSDGTNAQNQFWCTNQAVVTITAGTDTVMVAGVMSTSIRVCHLDFVSDTSVTFTIRQGTGSTCGTNTATLAGPYPTILSFAADYLAFGALRTTIAARDLCLHTSGNATVGGVITYAQF